MLASLLHSCSCWREGDNAKYTVPRDEGKAWAHTLRFNDLRTRGRFVGFAAHSTALIASDELWIEAGFDASDAAKHAGSGGHRLIQCVASMRGDPPLHTAGEGGLGIASPTKMKPATP